MWPFANILKIATFSFELFSLYIILKISQKPSHIHRKIIRPNERDGGYPKRQDMKIWVWERERKRDRDLGRERVFHDVDMLGNFTCTSLVLGQGGWAQLGFGTAIRSYGPSCFVISVLCFCEAKTGSFSSSSSMVGSFYLRLFQGVSMDRVCAISEFTKRIEPSLCNLQILSKRYMFYHLMHTSISRFYNWFVPHYLGTQVLHA